MMRKALANFLRHLAARFDPKPPAEVVTPIEFIPTEELSAEILKRNDMGLVFYAKAQPVGESFQLVGTSAHGVRDVAHVSGLFFALDEFDKAIRRDLKQKKGQ